MGYEARRAASAPPLDLSLSEHRQEQNGTGMANHHSSAQGPAMYLQNESWGNAGGGGTVMNAPYIMGMAPKDSFHTIQIEY